MEARRRHGDHGVINYVYSTIINHTLSQAGIARYVFGAILLFSGPEWPDVSDAIIFTYE
jgi:hypothetical protein